jgi:hypothetical protein
MFPLLNIRIKIYELMQVMNNDNLPHVPNIVILFILLDIILSYTVWKLLME